MICPKCGSNNITSQAVTDTIETSKIKGFGWIKSCIGFLFFSFPGILCGLCGMGKGKSKRKSNTRVVHVCQNCGNQF